MNPSQTEYSGKDLVILRPSDCYVMHDSLDGYPEFSVISYIQAEQRYDPDWCNNPLLVIEELDAT